jgi:hypothetical protein
MNNKIKKIGSMLILIFISIGFLVGCSFSTPLFIKHSEKRTMILEKPPIRIIITGEITNIKNENIVKLIQELDKAKYKNYNFDDTYNIGTDMDFSNNHKIELNSKVQRK